MSNIIEEQRCLDSLDYLLNHEGPEAAVSLLAKMQNRIHHVSDKTTGSSINTPYINTIPVDDEPAYPGDLELESRLESYIRWNAMAMVVNANRHNDGIGGHISTYASTACLYEVGFHHFFKLLTCFKRYP